MIDNIDKSLLGEKRTLRIIFPSVRPLLYLCTYVPYDNYLAATAYHSISELLLNSFFLTLCTNSKLSFRRYDWFLLLFLCFTVEKWKIFMAQKNFSASLNFDLRDFYMALQISGSRPLLTILSFGLLPIITIRGYNSTSNAYNIFFPPAPLPPAALLLHCSVFLYFCLVYSLSCTYITLLCRAPFKRESLLGDII